MYRRCFAQTVVRLLLAHVLVVVVGDTAARADQIMPSAVVGVRESKPRNLPLVDLAIEQFGKGDLKAAMQSLQAAAQANPDLPPPRLMLARMMLATQQRAQARAMLELVVIESPAHPGAHVLFGEMALAEGRLTDAQLQFEKASEILASQPISAEQKDELETKTMSGLASVAESRADWSATREQLLKLQALQPRDATVPARLGRAHFELGQLDEARSAFQQAVDLDPAMEPAETSIGWLWAGRQDAAQASSWLEQGVKRHPTSAMAHFGLAMFRTEQENLEAARPSVEAAARLAPRDPRVQLLKALVAHRSGQYDEAAGLLQNLLAEQPANVDARNLLALTLADHPSPAQHPRAVEIAEQLVKQYPYREDLLPTLGWSYLKVGRVDDSLRIFQAATVNGQARPNTAYFLASALAEKGQVDEARAMLSTSLQAPVGQFSRREEARARLQALSPARQAAGASR